jgi:site-specific DNA-methyltransferase (adenine-specific)
MKMPLQYGTSCPDPAPFPIELPYRLIQLYTFEADVILDPFMGSGQTALASLKTKRHYEGYDISKEYVALANKRIKEYLTLFNEANLFDSRNKKTANKKVPPKSKKTSRTEKVSEYFI